MEPRYGARRAVSELLAIFTCQWANGMLPQIRFAPGGQGYRPNPDDWGVTLAISGPTPLRTSGITQPPVMGLCAWEVFGKLGEAERAAYAQSFLHICDGLERYHDWLFRERDPWNEKLALCLHPWETGTDNSPAFDPLIETTRSHIAEHGIPVNTFGRADTTHVKGEHRPTDRDYTAYFGLLALFKEHRYDQAAIIEHSPFLLQDVLFSSLLAVSLDSLAQLQSALDTMGVPSVEPLLEKAERNRARSREVAAAIRGKLWSEEDGFFYSYDSRDNRPLTTPTVSGFMPLMGGIAVPQHATRLLDHLANPGEFWTRTPVPSTSVASPSFNPLRYWSGPSWPVTNWLVWRGLREQGSPLAEELRERTLAMIAEGAGMDAARRAAESVLELNSVGEDYTVPSRTQYAHAWLWDSAIVAAGWPHIADKPQPYDPTPGRAPSFWEYYHPHTGEPLGAPLMTWTASIFLDMLSVQ
jgi:hypothetical protein